MFESGFGRVNVRVFLFQGLPSVSSLRSVQGFKGSRVQGFKGSRVQRFKGSRVQGFKGSRVQGFRGSRV